MNMYLWEPGTLTEGRVTEWIEYEDYRSIDWQREVSSLLRLDKEGEAKVNNNNYNNYKRLK